ncbi:manganese ABC transporter ATP-binding protein, partial [Pseudomonas sp. FW305-70]
MGAGLLAKAECQSTSMLTDAPSSRASPLPHWSGFHRKTALLATSLLRRTDTM